MAKTAGWMTIVKRSGILVGATAALFIVAAGADACPSPVRMGPVVTFSQANVQVAPQHQSEAATIHATGGNGGAGGAGGAGGGNGNGTGNGTGSGVGNGNGNGNTNGTGATGGAGGGGGAGGSVTITITFGNQRQINVQLAANVLIIGHDNNIGNSH